jgi:ABC-type enterochelin transport system permease subunit
MFAIRVKCVLYPAYTFFTVFVVLTDKRIMTHSLLGLKNPFLILVNLVVLNFVITRFVKNNIYNLVKSVFIITSMDLYNEGEKT